MPPSVEELREQSEQTREALAVTVGELRDRVSSTAADLKTMISPAHIKQEFKDYVRSERESLVKSVQRRAKENPLQVAAMGAAIAYPAWGLLRAIPTPLLLIGAGLFLTSKKGQASAKDVQSKVADVVHQGAERIADVATSLQSDIEDRVAGVRYGAEELRDTVSSATETVVDKARAKFHDTADALKTGAGSIAGSTSSAADRIAGAASSSAGQIQERAVETATASRDAVLSFINDNALLVAGIGAALGAFIAASIPSSDAENKMFGAGSEKLKGKAREATAEGIEKAGDLAADAAGAVAAAAAREGLDASGVRQSLSSVVDSVRAVADRGIDTALGATPQPKQQQPANERNPS